MTLELVGEPVPANDAPDGADDAPKAGEKPAGASLTMDTDNSLAEATKEFDQGRIDGPLWTRSVVGAKGDKAQAKAAYLRARATALQALKKDHGATSAAPQAWMPSASDDLPAGAASRPPAVAGKADQGRSAVTTARQASPASHPPVDVGNADRGERSDATAWLRSPAGVLAVLTLLVVVSTLSYALWPHNSTMDAAAAGVAPGGARSASVLASNPQARPEQGQGFMGTIQKLKGTRNWNEVVVQALAWTQKEPGNAAAWNELSIGYTNTQQRDDAHAAARRAVDLAPKNALYWRNLGDLLDRDAPVEALLAFEEAISWNTQDGYSFVQTGILNTRLDRMPEAKVAFSKALALNPNDTNARCGMAMIAQRLTPSQANASAKSAALADDTCRYLIERASAPVNLGPTASSSTASGSH